MFQEKREYNYDGPVSAFGRCLSSRWEGTTWATSAEKALNNLAHQYKTMLQLSPSAKIDLDPHYLR